MLNNGVTNTRQRFDFGSRFFSGDLTLEYTRHAIEPRIKRQDDKIIAESRIIDNLTLDKVNSLLKAHWVKMFFKDGKWKIFVPTSEGRAIFIISTKKVHYDNGHVAYRAAFMTSYITSSDKKLKTNLDSGKTIFLVDDYFDSKMHIVGASDEEKELFLIEEEKSKETKGKKQLREKKKEVRKIKRAKESYHADRDIIRNKFRSRAAKSKLYIPQQTHRTRAEQREINVAKAKKERRKRVKHLGL